MMFPEVSYSSKEKSVGVQRHFVVARLTSLYSVPYVLLRKFVSIASVNVRLNLRSKPLLNKKKTMNVGPKRKKKNFRRNKK